MRGGICWALVVALVFRCLCTGVTQPPKPKAVTQNLTDTTSPKQQQKLLIPTPAPHHNTPLNNYLITKKETASQSPLWRGVGGVSRPRTASYTQSGHPKPDRHHLTKQQQKLLIPTPAPHRHTPLHPLSRGETNPYKSLITNKKHPTDIHVSIHIGT